MIKQSYISLEVCFTELTDKVFYSVGFGIARIYGEQGLITKTGQTGYAVFVVMVFLLGYLLFYLFNLG